MDAKTSLSRPDCKSDWFSSGAATDHPQIRPERALRSGPWLWCIASCGVASGAPIPSRFVCPVRRKSRRAAPAAIHEIKHDGFRILARKDGNQVKLITRNGYDFADRYPLIVDGIASLPVETCVIDGEAIVVDQNGLSVFDLLRYRQHDHAATLCAFDLLELDGADVRSSPIEERKQHLAWHCADSTPGSRSMRPMTATARRSTSMPAYSVARAS